MNKTQDIHENGTTSPNSPYNHNGNQVSNNHTRRTDNHRTEAGSKARGAEEVREAEEDKTDPGGNENLTTTGSQVIDTEAKDGRDTIREIPPQPRPAKNRTTTQTDQRERESR